MSGVIQNEPTKSRIKSNDPLHEPMSLTEEERIRFRKIASESRQAKKDAMEGKGPAPIHGIYRPRFNPNALMPQLRRVSVPSLSLFSGGGGLDLGFDLAGFQHAGSWEILDEAANTLKHNRPEWTVFGGAEGDVRNADWTAYKGSIAVVHGGPPCQPFSNAGKQRGAADPRDMWPEFVRAVLTIKPDVFVAENVAALASSTFSNYVSDNIIHPLQGKYHIVAKLFHAYQFGVPQKRKRVIFFGFRTKKLMNKWVCPQQKWKRRNDSDEINLPTVMGMRGALGLPDIGYDELCPTIRSGLTGPRHTTSILNSVSAQKDYSKLEIWPNGVAASREAAQAFVAKNGHYRLCVEEVQLLQGFPTSWKFCGATYMKLGQIGNSVVPPMAYEVAKSLRPLFE